MCGILGVVSAASPIETGIIAHGLSLLAHRGPDGEGTWLRQAESPWVALGHRRLSVIDLSDAAGTTDGQSRR